MLNCYVVRLPLVRHIVCYYRPFTIAGIKVEASTISNRLHRFMGFYSPTNTQNVFI